MHCPTCYFKNKGFSIVEIMVVISIIGIGILGTINIFSLSFKSIDADREKVIMNNLAMRRVEEWRCYTYHEIVPNMVFKYLKHTVNPSDRTITFSTATISITSHNKICHTASGLTGDPGYSSNINLIGAINGNFSNQYWYAGPSALDHTPGVIISTLTTPNGVAGVLTMHLFDDRGDREELIRINDMLKIKLSPGTFTTNPTIFTFTMTQVDTASGTITTKIEQTDDVSIATEGGPNPNAVLSYLTFDVLEGFTEEDSFPPYKIESQITSTYGMTGLVDGWLIKVTVSKPGTHYQPVYLSTTISP